MLLEANVFLLSHSHILLVGVAVIMLLALLLQRKCRQSVLRLDEGDPVEKGGGRWTQASQRQEQKWEEV